MSLGEHRAQAAGAARAGRADGARARWGARAGSAGPSGPPPRPLGAISLLSESRGLFLCHLFAHVVLQTPRVSEITACLSV